MRRYLINLWTLVLFIATIYLIWFGSPKTWYVGFILQVLWCLFYSLDFKHNRQEIRDKHD